MDFYIEGFENLIKILEKEYKISENIIQDLYDIAVCNNDELVNTFKSDIVIIKPIKRYITVDVYVTGYIVNVLDR